MQCYSLVYFEIRFVFFCVCLQTMWELYQIAFLLNFKMYYTQPLPQKHPNVLSGRKIKQLLLIRETHNLRCFSPVRNSFSILIGRDVTMCQIVHLNAFEAELSIQKNNQFTVIKNRNAAKFVDLKKVLSALTLG